MAESIAKPSLEGGMALEDEMTGNAGGANLLDGGAPFYDTYACADGKFIAIGPLEPQFYQLLLDLCGIDDADFQPQMDMARWPQLKKKLAAMFLTRSRAQWCELLEGSDVCFAPVLDLDEAPQHPHNLARSTFIEVAGVKQPAPAPRFSRTPAAVSRPPAEAGEHSVEILSAGGFTAADIEALRNQHVI